MLIRQLDQHTKSRASDTFTPPYPAPHVNAKALENSRGSIRSNARGSVPAIYPLAFSRHCPTTPIAQLVYRINSVLYSSQDTIYSSSFSVRSWNRRDEIRLLPAVRFPKLRFCVTTRPEHDCSEPITGNHCFNSFPKSIIPLSGGQLQSVHRTTVRRWLNQRELPGYHGTRPSRQTIHHETQLRRPQRRQFRRQPPAAVHQLSVSHFFFFSKPPFFETIARAPLLDGFFFNIADGRCVVDLTVEDVYEPARVTWLETTVAALLPISRCVLGMTPPQGGVVQRFGMLSFFFFFFFPAASFSCCG